jgi:hypothetical protein
MPKLLATLLSSTFSVFVYSLQVFALKTLFNMVIAPAFALPVISFWVMLAVMAFATGVFQQQFISLGRLVTDVVWGPHKDQSNLIAYMQTSETTKKAVMLGVSILSALVWLLYAWLLG